MTKSETTDRPNDNTTDTRGEGGVVVRATASWSHGGSGTLLSRTPRWRRDRVTGVGHQFEDRRSTFETIRKCWTSIASRKSNERLSRTVTRLGSSRGRSTEEGSKGPWNRSHVRSDAPVVCVLRIKGSGGGGYRNSHGKPHLKKYKVTFPSVKETLL